MKKTCFVFLFSLMVYSVKAQTASALFAPGKMEVTWLGIDFTNVKYLGPAKPKVIDFFPEHFRKINETVETDHNRYFIDTAFQKHVIYNTKYLSEINSKIDKSIITVNKEEMERFSADDIQKIISTYVIPDVSGTALTFIMEGMLESGNNKAIIWVVFFDAASKKVLFSKKLIEKADGMYFEAQWTNSIARVLNEAKSDWQKWGNPKKKK